MFIFSLFSLVNIPLYIFKSNPVILNVKKKGQAEMKYIIYNTMSGHGKSEEYANSAIKNEAENIKIVDIKTVDYKSFFENLGESDEVVICGGDGTLNRFVNDIGDIEIKNKLYYCPCGTGNDFCADVCKDGSPEPFVINEYIKDLPTVTVNGKDYKFINGVGYGIDGYCCEVGDKLRAQNKKANYTAIAIKGLLFHFKPVNATVVIDGKEYTYKKVWIAPTMFGGRYGGGMIPTPDQHREDTPKHLSLMMFHGSGKLKTLMIFPSIFKGEHVKNTKYVEVLTGNNITVKFDRPTPLQVDGETILNVSEYTARI